MLTVNGTGFINTSVVRWNSSNRTTAFVSASQLTATILASDVTTAGTAQVTVFNPAPGGGTSNAISFTIQSSVPNDNFADAIAITTTPFTHTVNTQQATTETSDPTPTTPTCGIGSRANSVWYRFTPTSAVTIVADTIGSNYDTVLSVWTGSPGAFTSVGCNDDSVGLQSRVTFTATAGTTYYLMVTDFSSGGGSLVFNFNTVVPVGGIERVSVASDGTQGNGSSILFRPAISGDGGIVAFRSFATNLVPGDTNGLRDVFVRDRQASQTNRVSVASDGTQGSGSSFNAAISADGRFVGFMSIASNLVVGDSNGVFDVFVHDRQTSQLSRVSVASDGTQGNNDSGFPALSADGRFVGFDSFASNLVAGDTNGVFDVFVHDRQTGQLSRVSVASDGSQGNNDSFSNPVSADGRFVAFESFASNLVAGDTNISFDVFLRDTCVGAAASCTPSTVRVSVASDGTQGNNDSFFASVSADGRFVAFMSFASNLVASDTNGVFDVFLRDTCVGAAASCTPSTTRVSVAIDGTQGNNDSGFPALSADGRFVAFESRASNLVAGDTNGVFDIFLRDRQTGQTTRLTASAASQAIGDSFRASISSDARFVTFDSSAPNLVAGDTNGVSDVFLASTGSVAAPVIFTTTLDAGAVGLAYSATLRALGGLAPLTWSIVEGAAALPPGLSLNATTGVISGTPTSAGTFNFTAQVSDASSPAQTDTQALSITILAVANPVPSISILSPSSANAGGAGFDLTVNGSNFVSSSVVRWNGANRPTMFVSNTQLRAAISAADIASQGSAQVTVFNPLPGGGTSGAATFTINAPPVTITTTRLPDTTGGKIYDFTIGTTGGLPPFTWSLSAGTLPPTLTLDPASGRISGTVSPVTVDATVNFTIQVADSSTPQQTDTQALSILVRLTGPGRNDTCTAASTAGTTAISNGTIRAALSPYGDVDVYSFQGTAGQRVTIETFAQRLVPMSFADTIIELLDSSCTRLTFNDDHPVAFTLDSLIGDFLLPSTGTFFIRVRDFRGDGRPDLIYELRLSGAN